MKRLTLILTLFHCLSLCFGQKPLFQDEKPLELTLTADFTAFTSDRSLKANYYPAELSFSSEGKEEKVDLKIKVRGRFRRDSLICNFPPIRMNFKKGKLPFPFQDQNKLKVVTHCQDDETILKEYYIYKAYQLFTTKSFLVRLARITYVDKGGTIPTETHYAFFIESEKHMAERNQAVSLSEDIVVRKTEVNQDMLARLHLFNYMIANYDFDVSVRQNIKIITNGAGKPIAVPYDFDWAGMVAASYTLQGNENKHPYFIRRKFKRLCLTDEEWDILIGEFKRKKDEILYLYDSSPYLSTGSKEESLKLYKNFFRHINRKKTISKVLQKRCS